MNKLVFLIIAFLVVASGILWLGLSPHRTKSPPMQLTVQTDFTQNDSILTAYHEITNKINECLAQKQWACAAENLESLSAMTPKDPALWSMLGKAFFMEEKYEDALAALKQAEALGILDSEALQMKNKATALDLESRNLGNIRSPHFELGFENSDALAASDSLFATLEHAYDSLCLLWDFYPNHKIPVVLYQSEQYEGTSPKPAWGAAAYDGKMRIPLRIMENWPEQRSVLIHELAHAFIQEMSQGKAPLWFQEGFAQMLDGTTLDSLTLTGTPPELSALQKSFAGHSDTTFVHELYAYSLLMATRLYQRAGNFSALKEFLESLATNTNIPDTEKIETELHTRFNTGSEPLRRGL
ncbi:MAG: hypothetical protein WCX75_08230, partial [Fibrobacteraceae bacterium]